jgi:hypothetical protein
VHTYEVGEIAYWSPGPDGAIDSRQDGEPISPPGIIPIGKIDAGAEVFDVPGSVKVTLELPNMSPRLSCMQRKGELKK